MECRKCGAELHPDQKVCIKCGEPTPAGGGFDYGEKEPWRPNRSQMLIAGGAIALLLLIVILGKVLHTTPPEEVAEEWFSAMAERRIRAAREMVTPNLEEELAKRNMDLRDRSDEYFDKIDREGATYSLGETTLDSPDNPTRAYIAIKLSFPDGTSSTIPLELAKHGRTWRVDRVY